MSTIILSHGLIVLINEIIPLVWMLFSLLNCFTIFLNDLFDSYVKHSWLYAIYRHSSVACERINVSKYPTCYSELNYWAEESAMWLNIRLDNSKCTSILDKNECSYLQEVTDEINRSHDGDAWIYC